MCGHRRAASSSINSPVDAFLTKIKMVGFLGLIVALPVVLYQLWAFIVPG